MEHGPILRYVDGSGRPRTIDLASAGRNLTIGRSENADISLAWDTEVSRTHAVVECLGDEWAIVDDGLSRNGTFVNGERINGRRRLAGGDRIRIGSATFAFHEFSTDRLAETATSRHFPPTVRSVTDTQRAVLIALCRPYRNGPAFAVPNSNQAIADELFLSVEAVRTHLKTLFAKFGVEDLPQNQKRVRLAELALETGIVSPRDL